MKEDYKRIKILIDKNEYFYNRKLILKKEFIKNNMLFADKLDIILNEYQRFAINDFLSDEFSIVKFNLIITALKATPN